MRQKRRRFREFFKNNTIFLLIVSVIILLPIAIAGNVIVKDGSMTIDGDVNVTGMAYSPTYINTNITKIRVYQSASQNIPDDTITKITMTGETIDTLGEWANSRFTATQAGYYQIHFNLFWAGLADTTYNSVLIYKNGEPANVHVVKQGAGGVISNSVSNMAYLDVGDYIEFYGRQNSGGTEETVSGSASTWAYIARLP